MRPNRNSNRFNLGEPSDDEQRARRAADAIKPIKIDLAGFWDDMLRQADEIEAMKLLAQRLVQKPLAICGADLAVPGGHTFICNRPVDHLGNHVHASPGRQMEWPQCVLEPPAPSAPAVPLDRSTRAIELED